MLRIGSWYTSVAVAALALPIIAHAGSLDPTFGSGGIATVAVDGEGNFAAALQPDGKVVCVGNSDFSPDRQLTLVRLDVNGNPDPTFGTGGTAIVTSGVTDPQPSDIAVMPDGKLMVVALLKVGPSYTSGLVRLNADGSLDTTFGVGGVVVQTLASMRRLAVEPDGHLIVAGNVAGLVSGIDFAATRFDANGVLDTSFGVGGLARADFTSTDVVYAMTRQSDGAIVVVGQTNTGPSLSQFGVARFLASGLLDPGFGTGGTTLVPVLGGFDIALAVTEQPDGRLLVAGDAGPSATAKIALVRLNANGTLDGTFGAGGIVTKDFSGFYQQARSIAVQPNGRILVAGSAVIANAGPIASSTNDDIRPVLLRYLPNGAPDAGFGPGGALVVTSVPNIYNGDFNTLFALPGGRALATGGVNTFSQTLFAATRFRVSTCGDGFLDVGEQCDDGNTANGDCCSSTCTLDSNVTPCASDGLRCTADLCDGAGTCRHRADPQPSCKASTTPAKSLLRVRGQKPLVVWKWPHGAATSLADFGDPVTTDDYTLCGFDESSATPAFLFEVTAPHGSLCGTVPCWLQHGATGFRYRDRAMTPDGMETVDLHAGIAGKARIAAKGRGSTLTLPALPLLLPIHVQLRSSNGGCWEATYGATGTVQNDAGEFEGRGQ